MAKRKILSGVSRSHKHRFEKSWFGSSAGKAHVTRECSCGARKEEPATGETKQLIRRYFADVFRDAGSVHSVFHEFEKKFHTKNGGWKSTGHQLMQDIERWAARHPQYVHITVVDDSWHMTSLLCIIEHRTAQNWMGLSVIFVPQNPEGVPVEFFLYPRAQDDLAACLRALQAKRKPIQRTELMLGREKCDAIFRSHVPQKTRRTKNQAPKEKPEQSGSCE